MKFSLPKVVSIILLPLVSLSTANQVYDATFPDRTAFPILTPPPPDTPRINGAKIFGVRPGKPVLFRIAASGKKPLHFSAEGLPRGTQLDPKTGWLSGLAPSEPGSFPIKVTVRNEIGETSEKLNLKVGDTICLTPPMGWNSWYAQSESVSADSIKKMTDAMAKHNLGDHGWTYINIDDCWTGTRHQKTKALQGNWKFPEMRQLTDYVHDNGFKIGVYSTVWMSTYAGYIGGSAPNAEGDYSDFYLPEKSRLNPEQYFGRYPGGIKKGLCSIGSHWFVDRDAEQFAAWGVDYVKYDWKEWTLKKRSNGTHQSDKNLPVIKTDAITKRFHNDFRAVDRDIVLSLSPRHDVEEDPIAARYANLWRLTNDIKAEWKYLIAPFSDELGNRLQHTRPGAYGDLDMLQIGNLGTPNRTNKTFHPTPLTPAEQYFQVSLWSLLSQPLLLSCDLSTLDPFTLNLITNDEVLAINQDPLAKPAKRLTNQEGVFEIWNKTLKDGSQAIGIFNLLEEDQLITLPLDELQIDQGNVRDLWRQQDIGKLESQLQIRVEAHGVALLRIDPAS